MYASASFEPVQDWKSPHQSKGATEMKVELNEEEGSFGIELIAETKEEAATIARFGLNHLRKINSSGVSVHKDGQFKLWITVGKRKDSSCFIGHPR
jgi:hypothetical protein